MADNLVFEESLNTEIDRSEFISKKWIYVNDNNNGNYTSQVVIDSTPLSNAGGWVNWSEGFILMPLLVELSSNTDDALPDDTTISDFSWAFKNGYWQMLNSMTVEFNNQNIVQQTPFLNVFRTFKCLTSWSKDDLENHGASCGFYPDSADSWSFCDDFNTASQRVYNGNGQNVVLTNNRNCKVKGVKLSTTAVAASNAVADVNAALNLINNAQIIPASDVAGIPTASGTTYSYSGVNNSTSATNAYVFSPSTANEGMLERQKAIYNDCLSETSTSANRGILTQGQAILNPQKNCETVYRTNKITKAAGAKGSHIWRIYAKLRLKDLADYFEKVPLLKGSTMRFYLNTNQAIVDFTSTRAVLTAQSGAIATNSILTQTSVNVVGGLTNPLMVASNIVGQGGSALPAGAVITASYQLSVSIYKNNFNQQTIKSGITTGLQSCRLYCPVYTMNPIAESKYLSLAPTKRVKYNDIFQYQFNNVKDNFNFLVSNGINNIQSVLVVPYLSQTNTFTSSANVLTNALTVQQALNPFHTSPAIPDPIMLTNFNVLISGVNLFLNNEQYDYEAFCQQLAQSNQLNGGLTTGLASGLISEKMFSQGYRYYYGNCSRILPSEEGVSRSVQIVGNNASAFSCDFMVFVEFQKEMVIDVATGARIE